MNHLLSIPLLFISICSFGSIPVEMISLTKAVKKGLISANFQYTSGGQHKRILGSLRNNTRKAYKVDIEPGTLFQAAKTEWQNHVVTKREQIILLPKSDTIIRLTAFCYERGDGGPKYGSAFKLLYKSNEKGKVLCQLLDSLNDISYSAQTAIWQFYAGGTPDRIYGEDAAQVMLLRNYVGSALGMPVTEYKPACVRKECSRAAVTSYKVS